MLKERYENRRATVREHISSNFNASTATKKAGSLRNLMQTADEHRRALVALGLNMDEMDGTSTQSITLLKKRTQNQSVKGSWNILATISSSTKIYARF